MRQTHTGNPLNRSRVVAAVLAVAAVGGWAAFGYSALLVAEAKNQLHGQAASLEQYQVQYHAERKRADDAAAELSPLRDQLSVARSEVERLSRGHRDMETELSGVRAELNSFRQALQTQNEEARAAVMRIPPRPTPLDVMAAQEALTELGFGVLKADGAVGESTRQAVEEFQRAAGLTVTGELHAETLQTLLRTAKVMAAQKEKGQDTL